jgi:hypothetical protein
MKTTKWLLAGALLSLGGTALAHNGNCDDSKKAEHHAQRAKSEAKQDAYSAKENVKQDASEVKSDAQEEGSDVRASLDNAADKADQKLDAAKDKAEQKADEAADRSAGRAEAVGNGLATSIGEAKDAVKGEPSQLERGQLDEGRNVRNTVTLSPFAMLTGSGLNFLYARPASEKLSWVAGANFARTAIADGAAMTLGVTGGVDYFLMGGNNEGLRIGPRLELGLGRNSIGANSAFGQAALAGEVGYNWISSKGLTAEAGLGLHGSVGASTLADATRGNVAGNFGPYGKLGIGYSW